MEIKQLFNCLRVLCFLPALVDTEDDGCGCVCSVNWRVGLFVMLREVDNDTKTGEHGPQCDQELELASELFTVILTCAENCVETGAKAVFCAPGI